MIGKAILAGVAGLCIVAGIVGPPEPSASPAETQAIHSYCAALGNLGATVWEMKARGISRGATQAQATRGAPVGALPDINDTIEIGWRARTQEGARNGARVNCLTARGSAA